MKKTALTALAVGMSACSTASSATAERQQLTVLAASSLTEAFSELEEAFERAYPGVDVILSFAGTQALAAQIRHGLAADVLASAHAHHVDTLHSDGHVEAVRPLAEGNLVIAFAPHVDPVSLEELGRVGSLVVGAPEVPVGTYTEALFDAAEQHYGPQWRREVEQRVVSRELNVRLVLAKVAMGEADAAIVYATDLPSDGSIRAVGLPTELAPAPTYHHARVVGAPSGELAAAWMAFVESDAGVQTLTARGFGSPAS